MEIIEIIAPRPSLADLLAAALESLAMNRALLDAALVALDKAAANTAFVEAYQESLKVYDPATGTHEVDPEHPVWGLLLIAREEQRRALGAVADLAARYGASAASAYPYCA